MPVLSENFIASVALGKRAERFVRDSRLPGFALRLRRKADGSVAKSFFVVQELPTPDGKRRRRKIAIGEHPTFTADAAREEARRMLQAIKVGDDPAAQRAAKRAAPVFEDLVEDFETNHLAEKKPATAKDYKGRIRRVLLPEFRGRRVADITAEMVRALVRKKKANPIEANRAVAVLSKMMARAIELQMRTDNPCAGIKRNRENVRERWLDEHDLPRFLAALAKQDGPHADLIRFLTVSGWRVSEARMMRWDMVDLPRMIVNLPDTKTGKATRHLSTDAATIIDRQPRRVGFVFSARGSTPVDYRKTLHLLHAICIVAGIDRITPHVLRHTAATWAAVEGAEAHELRAAFGWKTLAMTARYVNKSESLARRGAERAARAINVLGKPSADVRKIGG
jgi:integrase